MNFSFAEAFFKVLFDVPIVFGDLEDVIEQDLFLSYKRLLTVS